ncbi:hypothetical protein EMPS_11492 [Entomortierella parvispora]|uniref:Uncharacterized protein n=1 Tax=Entomortierella parvispora TaxID=205924 RepID=A0A9P3M2B7_9FUNG|nr:hypothetical protein EMPS_11492 [Entomortierella parvispora]
MPLINRPSTLVISLTAMRVSPPSRLFHVDLINSIAVNGTMAPQASVPSTPPTEPKKRKPRSVRNSPMAWSKDELDRLKYFYSDGRNPTIRSILSFFPGRSRPAIACQLPKITELIPRKRWSPQENARLLELHDAGVTTLEMLKDLPGRTQEAIAVHLRGLLSDSGRIIGKRMVSASVLGEEKGQDSDYSSAQSHGAIITSAGLKKPMIYWTEEEDDILKGLVQKAKDRNPDRWSHELALMLSDPVERQGLAMTRTHHTCLARLNRLQTQPFVLNSGNTWTADEDHLLMKSVYSQLGIRMNSISNPSIPNHEENGIDERSQVLEDLNGSLKKLGEKESWPKLNADQLKTVDWHRVALDHGTRQAESCQRRFDSHFKLQKGKRWTADEVEKLKDGLKQYGRDWAKVAAVVDTKTASQVASKYLNDAYSATKRKK